MSTLMGFQSSANAHACKATFQILFEQPDGNAVRAVQSSPMTSFTSDCEPRPPQPSTRHRGCNAASLYTATVAEALVPRKRGTANDFICDIYQDL